MTEPYLVLAQQARGGDVGVIASWNFVRFDDVVFSAQNGGAVATHLRIGNPLFSHILFGVYVGALTWLGLYLRDAAVRRLIPLRARHL